MTMKKPEKNEYAPYYQGYMDTLPDEVDIFDFLKGQHTEFVSYVSRYSPVDLDFRYAEGKWSRREVIGHCLDVERLMTFRGFTFLRGDRNSLPGFEQDDYVANGDFDVRSLESLIAEFNGLRISAIELFSTLETRPEKLKLSGIATGKEFTVKALVFIIAGHLQHHLNILKTKYDSQK